MQDQQKNENHLKDNKIFINYNMSSSIVTSTGTLTLTQVFEPVLEKARNNSI